MCLMGPLILRYCFLEFAVEHWFGCHATEPGLAMDGGVIEIWLIDWYNMVLRDFNDAHAPQKTRIFPIRPQAAWFNGGTTEVKRLQRQYERCWRATSLIVHRQLFTDQRTLVNNVIEQAKTTYYKRVIDACEQDQKALFRVVEDFLGTRREAAYHSGSRSQEFWEQFSDYFVTRISTIREWLDANPEVSDDERDDQECCTSVLPE